MATGWTSAAEHELPDGRRHLLMLPPISFLRRKGQLDMDSKSSIEVMPSHEDGDDAWRRWGNVHPSIAWGGLRCVRIDGHSADFEYDERRFPLNPNGAVNGGVISMIADQAAGLLTARMAPTGCIPVTATLHVQYHLPAFPPLTVHAQGISGGRVVRAVEIVVRDGEGRRCCTVAATMAIGPVRRSDRA